MLSRIVRLVYFNSFSQFDFKNQNSDSAVPGLNRNEAYNNDTIIPTRVEIERFNLIVKSLYHKIKLNDEETENMTQLRDSLLPKLIQIQNPV